MSTRTDKIASVIRHAVQDVITRGLNDPRVRGLISVTKVDVAPDLADAHVHVSILPAERSDLTMRGLEDAAGFIQREIGPAVAARRLPRLHFRLDESLKKQAALDVSIGSALDSEPRDIEPTATDGPDAVIRESEDRRT